VPSLSQYYEGGEGGGEHASEGEERIEIVAEWCREVVGDVLDIGCSDGRLAARLRAPGRRVIGVDVNPRQLEAAKRNLDAVKSFDITSRWPFADGEIVGIHMGAVIEHVFDYRSLFSEAARVLRPGGRLWISTPNMACFRHRIEVLFGRMPGWYTNFEHIRPWTVGWLDEQLRSSRLRRTRLRGAHIRDSPLHRLVSAVAPRWSSLFVAEYVREGDRA
jgi:SAM-dependent methyltransferase